MTETEKAYLAGIIDGEGSIALTKKHKGKMPSPQLNVSNNNLELLEYIQNITNCGYIREKKRSKPHHNQSYHWQIQSVGHILRILDDVKGYLRVKKPQASLILKHYKEATPRNGRYTPELLEKKNNLVKAMQDLNHGKSKSSIIRRAPYTMDEDIVHASEKSEDSRVPPPPPFLCNLDDKELCDKLKQLRRFMRVESSVLLSQ